MAVTMELQEHTVAVATETFRSVPWPRRGRTGDRQVGISILHSGAPTPLTVATGDRFKLGVVMTTSSARMEENELTPGPSLSPPPCLQP